MKQTNKGGVKIVKMTKFIDAKTPCGENPLLNPIIAGHPQSVEDSILNERMKNSLMGTQIGGCCNETEEMDSRRKVCNCDGKSQGLENSL